MNLLLKNKLKINQPVLQQLNNGITAANIPHAMPMKTADSNNDAQFEMDRVQFDRAYQPAVNYAAAQQHKGVDQIKRQQPGLRNGFLLDGPKTPIQKKWIGGNNDASNTLFRRKMANTGLIMSNTGAQSFKNPNDNNPRVDALARVRGGGACVPPKVTNRPVFVSSALLPHYYRIVSAGLRAMNGTTVNVPSSSANGVSPGFYSYTQANTSGTVLVNCANNKFNRSYNVMVIDRATSAPISFTNYDVFYGNSAGLTNALAALTSSVIVVIATYDEPETAGSSTTKLPQTLVDQIKRCGGSATFGSGIGSYGTSPNTYTGFIQYRSAYVLVGVPGCGVGNGIERYVGTTAVPNDPANPGDPNACIDLRIVVQTGKYSVQ
jgi:hypothetical protein